MSHIPMMPTPAPKVKRWVKEKITEVSRPIVIGDELKHNGENYKVVFVQTTENNLPNRVFVVNSKGDKMFEVRAKNDLVKVYDRCDTYVCSDEDIAFGDTTSRIYSVSGILNTGTSITEKVPVEIGDKLISGDLSNSEHTVVFIGPDNVLVTTCNNQTYAKSDFSRFVFKYVELGFV